MICSHPHKIIRYIILSASLLLVFASCAKPSEGETSETAEPIIIHADSGSASLTIPPGSLPENAAAVSIKITQLSAEDLDSILTDSPSVALIKDGLLAAYSFEPEGTEFSQPVSLTVKLPMPEDGQTIEVSSISSDGSSESLKVEDLKINPDTETITMTVPVAHFSYIAFHIGWMSTGTFEYPGKVPSGVPFPTTLTIKTFPEIVYSGEEADEKLMGSNKIHLVREGPWSVEVKYATKFLKPASAVTKSGEMDNVYVDPLQWICESGEPVTAEIHLFGVLETIIEEIIVYPPPNENKSYDRPAVKTWATFIEDVEIECYISSPQDEASQPEEPEEPHIWKGSKLATFDDPLDDTLCCEACIKREGELPDNIDIIRVQVVTLEDWREKGKYAYKITVITDIPFEDGEGMISVSFYDPATPQAGGFALFCPAEGTNITYSLMRKSQLGGEPTTEKYTEEMVEGESGSFSLIPTNRYFEVETEGNEIHFYIPSEDIPKESTWMVWTMDADGERCDEFGRK